MLKNPEARHLPSRQQAVSHLHLNTVIVVTRHLQRGELMSGWLHSVNQRGRRTVLDASTSLSDDAFGWQPLYFLPAALLHRPLSHRSLPPNSPFFPSDQHLSQSTVCLSECCDHCSIANTPQCLRHVWSRPTSSRRYSNTPPQPSHSHLTPQLGRRCHQGPRPRLQLRLQ